MKSLCTFFIPCFDDIFALLEETSERCYLLRELLNEASIIVCKSEEGANLSCVPGLFSFLNGLDLLRVHLDSFIADYEFEVFCFFFQELIFAEFGIQLVLPENF